MSTTAEPEPSARVLQRQPWPFRHCPSCGHEEFEVSCRTGPVVFSCQGCSRSWRFVLGYLQQLPADPSGLPVAALTTGSSVGSASMPMAGPAGMRIAGQG